MDKQKRYNIASTVRKAINAQAMLGFEEVRCSALLSRRGKKLNSIDRSPKENFTRLMHQYIESEQPDKIRVEVRNEDDALLWSKSFTIEQEGPEVSARHRFCARRQRCGQEEAKRYQNQRLHYRRAFDFNAQGAKDGKTRRSAATRGSA